jgi:bifunctional DNA-binding transcriptional regulator/antitoxin component of YhaV-PrlF toxin-antitoxin module
MVMLKTKITESGVLYIPKEIRDAFGRHMNIITDAIAVVMFPEDTEYEDVLTSLEIMKTDIEHRISLRKRKKRGCI